MTHHTQWYRLSKEVRERRLAERSVGGRFATRRIGDTGKGSELGAKESGATEYNPRQRCLSCNKVMTRHAWKTQCKDCDPVRTVD